MRQYKTPPLGMVNKALLDLHSTGRLVDIRYAISVNALHFVPDARLWQVLRDIETGIFVARPSLVTIDPPREIIFADVQCFANLDNRQPVVMAPHPRCCERDITLLKKVNKFFHEILLHFICTFLVFFDSIIITFKKYVNNTSKIHVKK
jgi:hypothetical protein